MIVPSSMSANASSTSLTKENCTATLNDRDVDRHPRADDFERDEQRQDHEHEDSEQPGRLGSDEHDVRPVHVV